MPEERLIIMANGLPGKMATIVARGLMDHDKYSLSSYALTGPGMAGNVEVKGRKIGLVKLIKPEMHEEVFRRDGWRICSWKTLCNRFLQGRKRCY